MAAGSGGGGGRVQIANGDSAATQAGTSSRCRNLLHLALLNSIVCGLEVCASAGFTYIPPMLLEAGINEVFMSIILVIGPALGVILVPVLAALSDRCSNARYGGRRLPFILVLAAGVLLSMIIIPNSVNTDDGNGDYSKDLGVPWSTVWLVVGVILLDFTSQACFNPVEALLSDMFHNSNMRDTCFIMYSAMLSIGGCIGYLITALDWNANKVGQYIGGGQEKVVFTLLSLVLCVSVLCTVTVVFENSMKQRHVYNRRKSSDIDPLIVQIKQSANISNNSETFSYRDVAYKVFTNIFSVLLPLRYLKFVWRSMSGVIFAPVALRRLFLCHLCCYTALFSHNLFYTDFIGQRVYGGNPNFGLHSIERLQYEAGVRAGSWGLFFHCLVSALYSLCIDDLVSKFGMCRVFIFGTASFTVSMFLCTFVTNIYLLSVITSATGILLATMSTLPYTLVTRYREYKDVSDRGVGTDMAVLDTAYFLSQILMPSCMGLIVHATGTVLTYIVTAMLFGAMGCFMVTLIVYDHTQYTQLQL